MLKLHRDGAHLLLLHTKVYYWCLKITDFHGIHLVLFVWFRVCRLKNLGTGKTEEGQIIDIEPLSIKRALYKKDYSLKGTYNAFSTFMTYKRCYNN